MMTETARTLSLHEQVLIEFDLDERVIGLRAVVVNVLPNALWLGLARPDSLLERLAPEQPLHLTFAKDGTALVASSRFVGHLGSSRSRLFSIEWPDDLAQVQRRAHLRMDAECPLQYTVEASDSGVTGWTGRGTSRNISAGGVLFETRLCEDECLAVGDSLELLIALGMDAVVTEGDIVRVQAVPDEGEAVRIPGLIAECEVVRVQQDRRSADEGQFGRGVTSRSLVALRFNSISDVAQDKIVRHLFSLQRQRRDPKKP
jgi:c-di-GMP-binding flagellar brake protein YcgR